ncbi:hypothetical protein ATF84_10117 [[Clostridium] innocuum]|nr:hypothetical protein ATF84_10117 [[Clostridium] innocuum]SSA37008.1 hypothetical protein SAMN04487929_10117 [[Clostridium] innocuum]
MYPASYIYRMVNTKMRMEGSHPIRTSTGECRTKKSQILSQRTEEFEIFIAALHISRNSFPLFLLFFLFLNDKLSNLNRIGSGPLANLISTAPEA